MRFFLIILAFLIVGEVMGQSYSFSQYEVEDGLIQSSVNCFEQDHFGNLWVGTSAGISRFDGENFVNYNQQDGLIGNHINDIFRWGDSLLIATNQGLSVFDGAGFYNYQLKDSIGKVIPVRSIFTDERDSLILVLEQNMLGSFDGEKIGLLDHSEFQTFFSGIATDQQGKVWLSTYSGHIYQLRKGKLHLQGGPRSLEVAIRDLFIDDQNRFWINAPDKILLYDPESHQISEPVIDAPGFGQSFKMLQDRSGMIWVTTSNGIFSFDPETLQADRRSIAFQGSIIRAIHRDREDNLWFGSFGDGFFKFRGRLITKLTTEEGLRGKTFMSLHKDSQDNYWFGSYGGGLSQLSNGSITNYGKDDGLSSNFVASITEDDQGVLWIATLDGLNYYDGEAIQELNIGDSLPTKSIYSIHFATNDSLLVCTTGGPVFFKDQTITPLKNQDGRIFDETILSIKKRDENQIILLSEKDVYVLQDGHVRPLLSSDLFNFEFLTSIEHDAEGRLWIATLNGNLYFYDFESNNLSLLNDLYELPSMMVFSMVFADDGSLLLGTQKGLTRLFFYDSGGLDRLQQYGKSDGFLGVEANANAVLEDDDGSIWFGTVNGIYRFQPDEENGFQQELQPHLTGLKLFYEDVNWTKMTDSVTRWYHIPQRLHLPPRNNHLMFSFRAICLARPDQVLYSFMLEGYEESWSPATNRHEAVYPNLPPGEYIFKVKARSPGGQWSTTPLTYTFYITPPFWQTWWFYLLSLVALILLLRLYVYWNLKREREQRVQLELEVKGRTREIQALNNSLEKRVEERTAELALSNRKFEVEFELRKLDQEKLARREREYRQLVNNLREVIFKTDTEGKLTFLNDRWQEYMGYPAFHSIGKHFTSFLYASEKEKETYTAVFEAIISKELPYFESEVRLQRKGGFMFWAKISTRIEIDDDGQVMGTNGSLVDIDQRKKAEFALKASEDRYKFLTENTQDIIMLHSPELYYFYASPRIYEVAGHEPEDIIGKSSLDYLHPDDVETYMHVKEEVANKNISKGVVVRFKNGRGEYRWYETFLKPNFDENGILQSFISSSRDVNDKVVLAQEIDKVRKKVAQDFHDEMGNNLASISVLSQLIQNKLGSAGQEVEALLNKIDSASKNLFSGTRDFIWAIDPKNDNLVEVYYNLKDFGEELFENTGINFYASYEQADEDAELKLPSGWSRQLVLIFKEAFTNALKYAEAKSVKMLFVISKNNFMIEVSDDGKGFPEKQLKSLRGIKNMRDRSAKIKASLSIESSPLQGSTIRLKQKIAQKGLVKMEVDI